MSSNEYDEEEVNKKLLQSRLDLLFARFNLLTRSPDAIDKLTSSIITYSEIYGPESVGLTPQYYYLADYFLDMGMGDDKMEKKRKTVVKNIYLKIADIWKQYFVGMVNPLFLTNDDQDLILAICIFLGMTSRSYRAERIVWSGNRKVDNQEYPGERCAGRSCS